MTGDIMTVSRLRMGTDGEGISTLVGFFGCPLNCEYCINQHCHDDGRIFPATPRGLYEPKELLDKLKQDEIYYLMTGGGVVFGGGEPLIQAEFIHEVCKHMHPKWKRRIETSLNVQWKLVELLLDDIDEWIIDIKDVNNSIYKKYTGAENRQVLDNLQKLKEAVGGSKIRIRVPRIPQFNTEEDVKYSVEYLEGKGLTVECFTYQPVKHEKANRRNAVAFLQ